MSELTQKFLRECFDYNPDTGVLTWRERPVSHFRTLHGMNAFKSQFQGKVAGSLNAYGYLTARVFDKTTLAHRIIWIYVHNEDPDQMDHINGVRSDNRLINLRNVTRTENRRNAAMSKNNTSGCMGVSRNCGKWQAYIMVNFKQINLGRFSSFDLACEARKQGELKYGFHPNHGRAI